jgi:hypothetical protein
VSAAPHSVPTLTEVIEIELDDAVASAALPLPPDSVALEQDMPAPSAAPAPGPDAVLEQLQLRLDAWLQRRLAAELEPALRHAIDHASAAVARELRAELPAMVRDALDAAQQHAGHPPAGAAR